MIPFNVPPEGKNSLAYIQQAIKSHKICGDGNFTKQCSNWLEERFNAKHVLLTTSCTHALEMAALLTNIKPNDEVIMPSFTFCSTADAFVQRGAKIVFVDIRSDTMNIDETLIENAITQKTRAIVPVHYAGVACEMDSILAIAKKYQLKVVEDAAQGVMASYKGKALGTIGDFGCVSFHETKNFSMGEGGALYIPAREEFENAEIIREKGTNRSRFYRGQIDKYTWVDYGSSYLPSELNAAYLFAQLEMADEITQNRLATWQKYYKALEPLCKKGLIELPFVPETCTHNAHLFYIKTDTEKTRDAFINHCKQNGVSCVFHYIPLHSSPAGQKFGRFFGEDIYTTKESSRLVRLPLYYNLCEEDFDTIINTIYNFFGAKA